MNRFILIISLFIFFNDALVSQSNLVLNPSFEDHYDTSLIGIYSFAPGWVTNWSDPNHGSSDYFLPNSNGAQSTPPGNAAGFEYPHSGLCYGGFVCLSDSFDDFHEYVQATLGSPLEFGKSYAIECFVSTADLFPNCISDIGFYFSNTLLVFTPIGQRITLMPQLENPDTNFVLARNGWQRISGTYNAIGGEQFLSIGNFTSYTACHFVTCGDSSPYQASYMFIDDVAVYDTSKVDTLEICMNDSIEIGGFWEHNEGLYTEIIGGLSIHFYLKIRPFTGNITIIEKPFLAGDSVRITLMQTGGIDSSDVSRNFVYVSTNKTIDVPMYNIYGCDSTVRYVCGTNIGIRSLSSSEANSFHIFPNPANDFLQLMINKNDSNSYSIGIFDITGKEIISQSLFKETIDISSLTSGMYFVKLLNSKTGKLVGTEKFVKE